MRLRHLMILVLGTLPIAAQVKAGLPPEVLYAKCKASVVTILTFDVKRAPLGQGSGFIVAKNRVVTNYHVLAGSASASIIFNDGSTVMVKSIAGASVPKDVVIVEADTSHRPPLPLGDELRLKVGETVYAIGAPKGLSASLSNGLVSAFREDEGQFLIQITAPIAPGSSGGPVLNTQGQVVGLTTSRLKDSSFGFAVGVGEVQHLLKVPLPIPMQLSELVSGEAPAVVPPSPDPSKLLDRALNAIGSAEKLTSIHTIRRLDSFTQSGPTGTLAWEEEVVASYPDRMYVSTRYPNGQTGKIVITPTFNYVTYRNTTTAVPPANLEASRLGMQFDPWYIAQHKSAFVLSYDGSENIGAEACDKLRIRNEQGKEIVWILDQSGRRRRTISKGGSGDVVTDLSDYRVVDGINVPFKRHSVENGRTSDRAVSQYEVNPPISPALFAPPPEQPAAEQPAAGLRIRVLQEKSVPYVAQSGGGTSTHCSITSETTMSCNSHDTGMSWQHVLNVMLVDASDGNEYIISCDRAWSWSKCVPLQAGGVYPARLTSKGMAVKAVEKGHEVELTYQIMQSKVLH